MAPPDEQTPNRIRKLRTASGMSRNALADKLGVGERTIDRWERGENEIPDKKKRALAGIFGGVSVDYMMGWEQEEQAA